MTEGVYFVTELPLLAGEEVVKLAEREGLLHIDTNFGSHYVAQFDEQQENLTLLPIAQEH